MVDHLSYDRQRLCALTSYGVLDTLYELGSDTVAVEDTIKDGRSSANPLVTDVQIIRGVT